MRPPSPTEHPNAYASLSSASATAFIVYEANTRFNLDVSELEAGFIVALVTTAFLALGRPKR